jgi:lipoyl(octanoyl) transferase
MDYLSAYAEMRAFTASRHGDTPDEVWLLQHPPVYTLGLGGRLERPPSDGRIPLERVDRGGQITYHGPGQIVMYVLLDLSRRGMRVRTLVHALEESVIHLLAGHGVIAVRRPAAPGVYVGDAKVAALGLRVRKGASYHGLALNVDMDLSPFDAIDPCGYPGLKVSQTRALGVADDCETLGSALASSFLELLARPAATAGSSVGSSAGPAAPAGAGAISKPVLEPWT